MTREREKRFNLCAQSSRWSKVWKGEVPRGIPLSSKTIKINTKLPFGEEKSGAIYVPSSDAALHFSCTRSIASIAKRKKGKTIIPFDVWQTIDGGSSSSERVRVSWGEHQWMLSFEQMMVLYVGKHRFILFSSSLVLQVTVYREANYRVYLTRGFVLRWCLKLTPAVHAFIEMMAITRHWWKLFIEITHSHQSFACVSENAYSDIIAIFPFTRSPFFLSLTLKQSLPLCLWCLLRVQRTYFFSYHSSHKARLDELKSFFIFPR